ncbi:polymer-forming cytoskeletal protein [Comamonas sp. lk]|uniref:bactofilin family protein n=1 Tax=Comamonas sp. lk TaxID=2201272 RepID=UPI000EB5D604|nr:polymer-forming cytoskeletal protein [Comamonas sp. lk]
MAVQNPFFGKRDTDTFPPRSTTPGLTPSGSSLAGAGPAGVNNLASNARSTSVPVAAPVSVPDFAAPDTGGSKLTVGPNIKLKGVEITDCDTLVVEGTVEATMNSRVIRIAEQGAFHGTAEIDIAEIRGEFNGTLTVREKLVIFGTGKVSGKIRYGKVVIEEGGQLSGQIEAGISGKTAPLFSAKPVAVESVAQAVSAA